MNKHFSSCREAVSYLDRFQFHGFKLGLERIRAALNALGEPQKRFPCIHAAGTNGKGSVCAAVCHVLKAAGFRTGFYSSPHLHKLNERFRINMEPVSDSQLTGLIAEIASLVEEGLELSYFEFTTAMAFAWFARMKVDLAVIETGLGGRLDATNIIRPMVSIITNVSLEHQSYLGKTIKDISREKGGIIKESVPVVTGVLDKEAEEVILARAAELKCPVRRLGKDFGIYSRREGTFDYSGPVFKLEGLRFGLRGKHQLENAATAIAALELVAERGFEVTEKAVRSGLWQTSWPARSEFLQKKGVTVLLDGAHNMSGVNALKGLLLEHLRQEQAPPKPRRSLLWACSDEGGDKDIFSILQQIAPFFGRIVITEPPGPRKPVGIGEWMQYPLEEWPAVLEKDWQKALSSLIKAAADFPFLVVSGSLYLVGAVRHELLKTGFEKEDMGK